MAQWTQCRQRMHTCCPARQFISHLRQGEHCSLLFSLDTPLHHCKTSLLALPLAPLESLPIQIGTLLNASNCECVCPLGIK